MDADVNSDPPKGKSVAPEQHSWLGPTDHTRLLFCLQSEPQSRGRDLATSLDISECAMMRELGGLYFEEVIEKEKLGHRNVYTVDTIVNFIHPFEEHRTVGDLVFAPNR